MDDSAPAIGSPGLASALPSLADLDDLDASPFVDDESSDEDATDYSDVLTLTSHSGNQPNQSHQEDEEWVVRVEDRTITISRLVTSSITAMVEQDDYDQDSVASSADSSSNSNSASSASPSTSSTRTMEDASLSNSGNESETTDPGDVVALLSNTVSPPTRVTTIQRLGPQRIVSDSSGSNSEDSDDTTSDTDSQDGPAKNKKSRRFWIVDSLHQKRKENQAKAAAEQLQMQSQQQTSRMLDMSEPEESSSSPSVLSFVDPASFMERMPQLEKMQEEHDSYCSDDDNTSSGQDTSMSEIHLLDMDEEDEENSIQEGDKVIMEESDSTIEEYIEEIIDDDEYEEEEVVETEDSLSTVEEEITEEEEAEEIVIEEAPVGQKQCMILCTRMIDDESTNARQKQTIQMLQNNGIPFDILYGDDAENHELKQLLFQLAGVYDVYPQLFITTPDGETAYWGDWNDLVDNSVSDDGGLSQSQSSESLPTVANDFVCEFVWERVGPSADASSFPVENKDVQQQNRLDKMADESTYAIEQVVGRDCFPDSDAEDNHPVPVDEQLEHAGSAEQQLVFEIAEVAAEENTDSTREKLVDSDTTSSVGVIETDMADASSDGKLDMENVSPEITDEGGSQEHVVSEDCQNDKDEKRVTPFALPEQVHPESAEEDDVLAPSQPAEIAQDDKEQVDEVSSLPTTQLVREEIEKEDTLELPEPTEFAKKEDEGSRLVPQEEIVQEEINEDGHGICFEPHEKIIREVTEGADSVVSLKREDPVAEEMAKQEHWAAPIESVEQLAEAGVKEGDSSESLKPAEQVDQEKVHSEDLVQIVKEDIRCSPSEKSMENPKEEEKEDKHTSMESHKPNVQEQTPITLNLRPDSEEAVSSKLSEPRIESSEPQTPYKVHSPIDPPSLFNKDISATNESPFQPSPFVERVEQSNCNQVSSPTRVGPPDALMEKIKPSSKTCAVDAVMAKVKSIKAASQGKTPKSKKKDKPQQPKKEAKSKAQTRKKNQERTITKETKVQVENPVMNCYSWYNRMGRPSRSNMKRRVEALPKSCGVEIEHIDLLPWDTTGTTLQVRAMREILLGKPRSQQQ